VVSFTPRPLYPQGKRPWYPLDRRLCGPQHRSEHCGEEIIPSPRRESNPRKVERSKSNYIKEDRIRGIEKNERKNTEIISKRR
jgi:hypothetical protein